MYDPEIRVMGTRCNYLVNNWRLIRTYLMEVIRMSKTSYSICNLHNGFVRHPLRCFIHKALYMYIVIGAYIFNLRRFVPPQR